MTMLSSDLAHAIVIFGLTFVLEDIAVLGAALLVVNSMISFAWAAGSSFAGIWLGDLGLYVLALQLGRPVLEKPWFRKLMGKVDLRRSEGWFQHHGSAAILLSRAIPGTRLPTYLAAGLLKVPAARFFVTTAVACFVWVGALFWISYHVGMMAISAFEMFRSEAAKVAACVIVALVLAWPLRKLLRRVSVQRLAARWTRMRRWEFWHPAAFYIPVAFKYLQLALKYRSISLPLAANPGIETGGFIGESKFQTLNQLQRAHPDYVAETFLIPFRCAADQWTAIERLRAAKGLEYPLVFKPDVGQRGFGFRIIQSDEEARTYIEEFRHELIVQQYAPGPCEAGILYYRVPGETRGRIFSITEKLFPSVTGDGRHTLEQLIRNDPRASAIADIYLKRFEEVRGRILKEGKTFRLAEAGNHCQGAIFLDGGHLWSRELEDRVDAISRSIDGFFVGRYDLRYSNPDALRRGEDFQIIELNGASSEATSIYDSRNSLLAAYRTLFRQWEIVFQIADENRKRGFRPEPVRTVFRNWMRYREQVALHPLSD